MSGFFNQKHITSTGSTQVGVANMGILYGVVLNQVSTAAASASLVTIADATTTVASTSTQVIGIIDTTRGSVGSWIYECVLVNGLNINVASGASPLDLTVLHRD